MAKLPVVSAACRTKQRRVTLLAGFLLVSRAFLSLTTLKTILSSQNTNAAGPAPLIKNVLAPASAGNFWR